jgi:hypothetical protein
MTIRPHNLNYPVTPMLQPMNVPPPVCPFYVRLRHFTPTIWRRLEVVDRTPIGEVFQAIAVVLAYRISTPFESVPLVHADAHSRTLGDEPRLVDGEVPLGECLPDDGSEMRMAVELGAWKVEAVFRRRRKSVPNTTYPRCTGGQGWGIPDEPMRPKGFRQFLRALADDKHPRHGAALRRAQRYDMAQFDVAAVNDDLRRFCRPVSAREVALCSEATN